MQSNKRETTAAIGVQGAGKTRWMQRYVEDKVRLVCLEGGFKDEREYPGVKVHTLAELLDYLEAHHDTFFRVRYVPTLEEFPIVCDAVYEIGGCTLLIDEAWRFLSSKISPVLPPEFIRICKAGRHEGADGEGISVVVASDAPSDFPTDLRRCIRRWIVFNTGAEDVDWLRMLLRDRELAERCADFPDGHYLEYIRGVPGVTEHDLPKIEGGAHVPTVGGTSGVEETPDDESGVLRVPGRDGPVLEQA